MAVGDRPRQRRGHYRRATLLRLNNTPSAPLAVPPTLPHIVYRRLVMPGGGHFLRIRPVGHWSGVGQGHNGGAESSSPAISLTWTSLVGDRRMVGARHGVPVLRGIAGPTRFGSVRRLTDAATALAGVPLRKLRPVSENTRIQELQAAACLRRLRGRTPKALRASDLAEAAPN
jgi:hypothetical protein